MPIWLIQIIVGVVLTVASTLIQQATAQRREPTQQVQGFRGSVQTGGKVPQGFLVGTIGVPGKLEYANSWGASGGTPNAYNVDVISFGDLPISGFVGLFVNSAPVTVATTGHVTQGYPVAEYLSSGGANHLWWEFFDGTQTTANTYLTASFGSDPDRPWEADMIGRGVPYLTLTALLNETLWSGFPSYMAVFQGIPLLDPRLSTALGGDGLQDPDDPSTWAFSDNNLVIIYNILRGIQYEGARVWGGEAREYQLPYAPWAAAMDRCDDLIDLDAGGTEKRYRAGREIFLNERPADVVREFMVGANARIAYSGGQYFPLVDVPTGADFEFTDADILVSEETTLDELPNLDEVINGATATYVEPVQAWEEKETAPYIRSDLVAADDNREQLEGLSLTTTFSGTQAQRVLKATVEESRRFRRHVVPLRPAFGQYRPLQVAAWTSEANSYTDKLFLVTAKTEDRWGRVVFGLQEIDPADFDWNPATDEQPLSFAPLTPIRPVPQVMSGWGVAPYIFPDEADNDRRFGIEVEFAEHQPDVHAVRVQVKEDFGDERLVIDSGEYAYDVDEEEPSRIVTGSALIPATDYLARGKFLPISQRETEWSDWLPVTTPNVSDVEIPPITPGMLAEETLNRLYGTIDQIIARQDEIEVALGDNAQVVMEGQIASKEQVRGLMLRSVSSSASVLTLERVLLGPGGALAQLTQSVQAIVNNVMANGYVRLTAEVTPETGTTIISFGVKATNDQWTSIAALELGAQVTGEGAESFIRMMADRLDFIRTSGEYLTRPFAIVGDYVELQDAKFTNLFSYDLTSLHLFAGDAENPAFIKGEFDE